ncbi:MAG: hypothetical protein HZB77_01005 [Chloroflexi bacterium]|nr:hypothetical protein [Chloroflexota bacterium]
MRFEEKVGRRVMAADGKEIFIGADLANTMMELDRESWEVVGSIPISPTKKKTRRISQSAP